MEFKQYPSYKNSGVEWLGEVPEGWCIFKSNKIFKQSNIRAYESDEQLTASQKYGVIPQSLYMQKEESKVVLALSGIDNFKHVDKNDFVISLRSFQGGIELCFYDGCVSPAYTVLKPNKVINYSFWAYLFKSTIYISVLNTAVDGIREGKTISYTNFGKIYISIPSLSEQSQIANYLDTETARIDNLISKQEKLIELLEEQRKSIISHAVTKGLNPNAPMKDSGVEWLGEVPEHWTISRVKFNFKNLDSRRVPLTSEERSYKKGNYPYYGASGIIDYIDNFIFDEDLVIFSEDGANLIYRSMPICFVATGKYWVNNHAHILKSFDELTTYWSYVLESVDVNLYITGATQPKVTAENLGNIFIAFPPSFDERLSIHNYILEESSKIDILVLKQKSLIEKLKEYRASIISHAVTGKIDVREWVA